MVFKVSMQSVTAFVYTEDKGIVEIMHFSRDVENENRLDSVRFALILLSKMKGFRKWISRYQFLKARIVGDTVYGQKLQIG